MNIKEVICMDEKFVIEKLDGLPKEKEHCAKLVINTLKKAIKNIEWKSLWFILQREIEYFSR